MGKNLIYFVDVTNRDGVQTSRLVLILCLIIWG